MWPSRLVASLSVTCGRPARRRVRKPAIERVIFLPVQNAQTGATDVAVSAVLSEMMAGGQALGENGVTYACQAPTEIDGIIARRCIDPSAAGGVGFEGLSPAAAGGIAAVIVAVAVIASNDDDANGTNGSNGT